jgi:uncharacterized protein YuzE
MSGEQISFEVSLSARGDGTVEAMYLLLSNEPVVETRELDGDTLLADYDENDELVGIEVLAPVPITKLLAFINPPLREPIRRFLTQTGPQEALLGS